MLEALRHRRLVESARREVAAFVPRSEEQQRTQRLLFALLNVMAVVHCQPGRAADFAAAWESVEFFRRVLESPEPPQEVLK